MREAMTSEWSWKDLVEYSIVSLSLRFSFVPVGKQSYSWKRNQYVYQATLTKYQILLNV